MDDDGWISNTGEGIYYARDDWSCLAEDGYLDPAEDKMDGYPIQHPPPEVGIAYLIHNIYCNDCKVDPRTVLATMRAAKQNL